MEKAASEEKKITIMVVDDHEIVRNGLESLLNSIPGFQVVARAASGHDAVMAYCRLNPDIVLMDMNMPDLTAIFAAEMLIKRDHKAKIIMTTTYLREEEVFLTFKIGAKAYIPKDIPFAHFEKIINKVYLGGTHIPLEMAWCLAKRVGREEMPIKVSEILKIITEELSPKDIIRYLDSGSQYTRRCLYEILFDLQEKEKSEIEKGGCNETS